MRNRERTRLEFRTAWEVTNVVSKCPLNFPQESQRG